MLAMGTGVSSPKFERGGINDRSLDRVSAGANKNLMGVADGKGTLQTRAELLQNEYKKVIENHPGTILVPGSSNSKYDDTDFLSQMFTKKPKGSINNSVEPSLGLNK